MRQLGLGCMGMSDLYGPADRAESIATIRSAVESGVTLLDTADFYGSGHNEMLIAEAISNFKRDEVRLSVKYGAQRDPSGNWIGNDISPAATKNALAYSLRRLGTDYVDIYRPARLDGRVPVEEVVGAIAQLVNAGYVRAIGLSEVSAATIRRAHAVHPIHDVQIEYSLMSRGIEKEILPTCRELNITVTAYGVLSRGLLSGHWTHAHELAAGDFRSISPRFQGANLTHNLSLVNRLRELAARSQMPVAQVAIAWVLSRGSDIMPVIGARRRDRLQEALGARAVQLSAGELAEIEALFPAGAAAGERYNEAGMAMLDSER